jgi:hypothetical protein
MRSSLIRSLSGPRIITGRVYFTEKNKHFTYNKTILATIQIIFSIFFAENLLQALM